MGEGDQKLETSSCNINKSWGYNVHHSDYCQQYCFVCLKVAKTVDLKNSHHKNKNGAVW